MLDSSVSGCIHHPGVEASIRCKQCGAPVCRACVVAGQTGRFCSETCRDKHQGFIQKVYDMESNQARGSTSARLRKFLGTIVIAAAALVAVGVVSILFDVPVLADLAQRVRANLGL